VGIRHQEKSLDERVVERHLMVTKPGAGSGYPIYTVPLM